MPDMAPASGGPEAKTVDLLAGHERYRLERALDFGGPGPRVLLAEDTSRRGLMVCVLLVECGEAVPSCLEKAIKAHASLRHPHVAAFHDVFAVPGYVAVATEFPEEGSLLGRCARCARERRVPLQETLARWFFQQTVVAVQYCHRKGLACRDIRLDTILLNKGALLPLVKLCAFGYSRPEARGGGGGGSPGDGVNKDSRLQTTILDYLPPEMVANRSQVDPYKGDIWALGVVLYAMLSGQYPFTCSDISQPPQMMQKDKVIERILNVQYCFSPTIPKECRHLISRCLELDPDQRASIEDLLQDKWFKKNFPAQAETMNDCILASESGQSIQIRSVPHEEIGIKNANQQSGGGSSSNWMESKIEHWLDEAMMEEDEGDKAFKDSNTLLTDN